MRLRIRTRLLEASISLASLPQMTCALREMMLNGQTADAVVSLFPRLFGTLLVRLGSSLGVQLPKDINSNSLGPERKTSSKAPALFDVCG